MIAVKDSVDVKPGRVFEEPLGEQGDRAVGRKRCLEILSGRLALGMRLVSFPRSVRQGEGNVWAALVVVLLQDAG